jgi:tetratricopeptide (TPR) repeat protein/transcriptional regulator with XRE-family HTH domain
MGDGQVLGDGGFGALLRRHRLAAALTQEELAERSGLTARAIANMERGRTSRPYTRSVHALADALGLQGPQRELLDRTSRLAVRARNASAPDTARPGPPEPRQLPGAVTHFCGRADELAALTSLLAGAACDSGAAVIAVIAGTAGVGKTALAVQWAHQVAGHFPDGQLYMNLRGYDPGEPVAAADALAGLLRSLGVPGSELPDGAEDRARLYRTRLAGRRVLVLLDNARDSAQVRPLLPGDSGCVTLVTSRDSLAGLVATDGARRLHLDVLPLADAVGLLRSLIGKRAEAEPVAADTLASQCSRLPLALRVAAELAAARPAVPLADLAAELAADRLDLLDAGEDLADVRAVFSWSLRQLPEDVAGAFALLGLHPGEDLDVHAAAALTGTSTGQVRRALGRLQRASLVSTAGPGRYGMHDLLRAYAAEQTAARETDGHCDQALARMFDYYLSAAAAAMDALFPAEAHQRPRISPASVAIVPAMPGQADARAWLDAERANLVAVAVYAAGHNWPGYTSGLAATLFRYLMNGSHLSEAHTIYGQALHAARRSGDLAAEASALNGLGSIGMMKGQFRDAADYYQAALERYRDCRDHAGQARVLHNLGQIEGYLHNHQSAAGYHSQAIACFNEAGDSLGMARALTDLASAEAELGSPDQASEHLRLALQTFRDANDEVGEARVLSRIGELSFSDDQLTEAATFFEQALAIWRRIDNPALVATNIFNLGDVSVRQGNFRQAIGYYEQALPLFRQAGYQHGETMTFHALAEALQGAGRQAAARAALAAALRLAAETGNTYEQASAHRDLAASHHSAGEHDQARHHWQQALTLYTQLGAPEADQIRTQLAAAPPLETGEALR